jgi:hypothetical protein
MFPDVTVSFPSVTVEISQFKTATLHSAFKIGDHIFFFLKSKMNKFSPKKKTSNRLPLRTAAAITNGQRYQSSVSELDSRPASPSSESDENLQVMDENDTDEEADNTSDDDYVEGTYFAQVHPIRDIIFGELAASLRRKAWGEKKDREIMDICLHIAVFLSWSFRFLKNADLDPSIESVNDAFDSMLEAPHSVLEKFTNHLDVDHKKKPTTTKKYLNSIKTYAKWQSACNRRDTQSLRDCVGYITKHYATAVRKYRSEHRVSIDDMVQERKIPVGGLHKMREMILAGIQEEMVKTVHVVTRRTYRGFCALMFSAVYTLSPQGRIGGLEHLAFNQKDELMEEWDTPSTTFKTGAKFGFQIFALTSDTEKLFRLYIDKYRPHAAGRARVSVCAPPGSTSKAAP